MSLPVLTRQVFALEDIGFGTRDEDMRIIGRDGSDEVGSSLAIGDVDGDMISDILVGAPRGRGPSNSRAKAGEVALVFGAPDLAPELPLENAPRTFYGATVEARLGHAVAVGDVNDDGIGDIIMGAPEAKPYGGGPGEGGVYIFYGGPNVASESITDLAQRPADLVVWGSQQSGRLGNTLTVGDFNDDGIDDIAMAAPREGDPIGRTNAGNVYLFFGRSDINLGSELTARISGLDAAFFMLIRGWTPYGVAGQSLAAGDVNGDGIDDLLIGVPRTGATASENPGEMYVLFGAERCDACGDCEGCGAMSPNQVIDLANPLQVGLRVIGPLPSDRFALSVGTADIDGDGTGDLLIGAPRSEIVPALPTGHAYAIFGRDFTSGTTINLGTTPADISLAGPHSDAELGSSITGGDLNNDGIDEWIVGAPKADKRGSAYRLTGRESWPQFGVAGALTLGARTGDRCSQTTSVGDVNDDGIADLVVSSPKFDGLSGEHPEGGAVYVVLGVDAPEDPNDSCTDEDEDGFFFEGRTCGPADCNDEDANVNPGVSETCEDGIDNDCDGLTDWMDAECGGAGCTDIDGDFFAREGGTCGPVDCNDQNSAVNPWALEDSTEDCEDGIDNDCDGAVDGIDTGCGGWGCTDADMDGVCLPDDCDDDNQAVRPGIAENCEDGLDNDCDGAIDGIDIDCGGAGCTDADHDASCIPDDCDDDDPAVNPRMSEDCDDGIDNDCDGHTDGADDECDPQQPPLGKEICNNCVDDDGNGLGDLLDPACTPTPLDLKVQVVGRVRKLPTIIKRVRVKTTVSDPSLFEDPSSSANGLTVGIAFSDGTQSCMSLDTIKRSKKRTLVVRNGKTPKAKLRLKRTKKDTLKIKFVQKGKLQLPGSETTAIFFGVYGANHHYHGETGLQRKNGKKLIAVKTSQ